MRVLHILDQQLKTAQLDMSYIHKNYDVKVRSYKFPFDRLNPRCVMDIKFHCFAESEDAVTYGVEVSSSSTVTASAVEIANYIDNWIKRWNTYLYTF